MARKRSKDRCCDCVHWKPGDWWKMSYTGLISDGICEVTGKQRLNCRYACQKDFKFNPPNGVIITGNDKEVRCSLSSKRMKEWMCCIENNKNK